MPRKPRPSDHPPLQKKKTEEDINSTTQLRFEYWLVGSQHIPSNLLTYTIQAPSHLTAFYAYFYRVSFRSEHGDPRITQWSQGICDQYWCRSGTTLEWSIGEKEAPAEEPWGTLEFKCRPNATSGNLTVTAPITIVLEWKTDWLSSILGLFVVFGIPSIVATAVLEFLWHRLRRG